MVYENPYQNLLTGTQDFHQSIAGFAQVERFNTYTASGCIFGVAHIYAFNLGGGQSTAAVSARERTSE
jgi:hypothetical protein